MVVSTRDAKETMSRNSNKAVKEYEYPIILMVSGGADSLALLLKAINDSLKLFYEEEYQRFTFSQKLIHVLHVNHMLRGDDALRDEEFVKDVCNRFGVACHVVRKDVGALASAQGENVECMGRQVRYSEAQKLQNELANVYNVEVSRIVICSAHSANDRTESFFINAVKGAGLSGLTAIDRVQDCIQRPLLDYSREDLEEYVASFDMSWCVDETNKDTAYTRSFVRYEVLPKLKKLNSQLVHTVSANCDILHEEDEYMNAQATALFERTCVENTEYEIVLDLSKLTGEHKALLRRVIRLAIVRLEPDARMPSIHIERILELVSQAQGSLTLEHGMDVRVAYGLLYFRTAQAIKITLEQGIVPQRVSVPGQVKLSTGKTLRIETYSLDDFGIQQNEIEAFVRAVARESQGKEVFLDAEKIMAFTDATTLEVLYVDSIQSGDIIQPFGMGGKQKKLADVFDALKIPSFKRAEYVVVRIADSKDIVYVESIRADERFKCDKTTSKFIKLIFS